MFIEHLPGSRNYGRHSRIYMEKYLFEKSIKLIIESKFINSENARHGSRVIRNVCTKAQ